MFSYVCSLKVSEPQVIESKTWTVVKFPYLNENESSDEYRMHEPPAGLINWKTDARSGIITPVAPGWGVAAGMVQFADGGDADEFRTQFMRTPGNDTTATQHVRDTVGGDFYNTMWPMYFKPDFGLVLRVYHNASTALNLTTAEFKILI